MNELFKAAPHVRMHRGQTFVIKAGGGTIARPAAMRAFAKQVAVVQALGSRVVVVHGGGPQTDSLQRLFGEEPRMVDGRRVTSSLALRALRLATGGELNGDLTAALVGEGVPAVGIGGASLLIAERRQPVLTSEGVVDYGEVGDLKRIDATALHALLDAGRVPVVAPPAGDGRGSFLNVNADLAASSIAIALAAAKLVLVTGAPGVLRDPKDPSSLVSALSLVDLAELERSGALQGGMKVKSTAIRQAIEGGVGRVHVVSGADPEAMITELYTNHGAGTLITKEPEKAPAAAMTA